MQGIPTPSPEPGVQQIWTDEFLTHLQTRSTLSTQTQGFDLNLFNFFCVSHGGVNHPCRPETFLEPITVGGFFSMA